DGGLGTDGRGAQLGQPAAGAGHGGILAGQCADLPASSGVSFSALLLDPFLDYAFMRRALVACLAISLGSAPIGVFLILRRMSLLGDALSHAILPGAAVGFVFGGLSLWP